jgi:hypothetical protein
MGRYAMKLHRATDLEHKAPNQMIGMTGVWKFESRLRVFFGNKTTAHNQQTCTGSMPFVPILSLPTFSMGGGLCGPAKFKTESTL